MSILEKLRGKRVVFLDTETTGFSHFGNANGSDRILSIGMVKFSLSVDYQQVGNDYYSLLNPCGKEINPHASRVNGIRDEDVADQPTFEDECDKFLEFIGDDTLIAFNAKFDIGFINAELSNASRSRISRSRVFCLYEYLKDNEFSKNNLDAICLRYGIPARTSKHHNSLEDAMLVMNLFFACHGVDIGEKSNNNLQV